MQVAGNRVHVEVAAFDRGEARLVRADVAAAQFFKVAQVLIAFHPALFFRTRGLKVSGQHFHSVFGKQAWKRLFTAGEAQAAAAFVQLAFVVKNLRDVAEFPALAVIGGGHLQLFGPERGPFRAHVVFGAGLGFERMKRGPFWCRCRVKPVVPDIARSCQILHVPQGNLKIAEARRHVGEVRIGVARFLGQLAQGHVEHIGIGLARGGDGISQRHKMAFELLQALHQLRKDRVDRAERRLDGAIPGGSLGVVESGLQLGEAGLEVPDSLVVCGLVQNACRTSFQGS